MNSNSGKTKKNSEYDSNLLLIRILLYEELFLDIMTEKTKHSGNKELKAWELTVIVFDLLYFSDSYWCHAFASNRGFIETLVFS